MQAGDWAGVRAHPYVAADRPYIACIPLIRARARHGRGFVTPDPPFPDVPLLRKYPPADRTSDGPRAAGIAAGLLLALRQAGEGPVAGPVLRGALGRPARHGDPVVHRPRRHHGHDHPGRDVSSGHLALARRHGRRRAGPSAGYHLRALADHEPGDRRPADQPDPLAVALARRAPELGLLPKRFRRAHLQQGHADRSGPARTRWSPRSPPSGTLSSTA